MRKKKDKYKIYYDIVKQIVDEMSLCFTDEEVVYMLFGVFRNYKDQFSIDEDKMKIEIKENEND